MSGIYFHIPFCKQACHYCNFHFSTSLKHKDAVLKAMKKELALYRKQGWKGPVETVYFGGGTPSLLSAGEIEGFLDQVATCFGIEESAEITLEANPDDLSRESIEALGRSPVNRLSVGIQSFNKDELRWMNRAHTREQALESLDAIATHFPNYSMDLIYGVPGSNLSTWESNLALALGFSPPHISAYALTVEPKTALHSHIERGLSQDVDEEGTQQQFEHLVSALEQAGYDHYEISNFAHPGFYSRNNSAYWKGSPYLGIGPSAHSFDGRKRWWNPSHNLKYLRALENGQLPGQVELLSPRDRYNETVMTGLRTRWGVSLSQIRTEFGKAYEEYLILQAGPYLRDQFLFMEEDVLYTARKGKFLADGIASDLFMINLK
ncbi:MAG: radical SAM family heme chaperone HemW [Robiginitalea sp.]|jgi:oxygen-independent coproporphyrinogen-3 oxidase